MASADKRTFTLVWAIEVDYGHGFEWETTEETWHDAREQLATYRANVTYPVRARRRRLYSEGTMTNA